MPLPAKILQSPYPIHYTCFMNRKPQDAYVIDFITGQKHKTTLNTLLRTNYFTIIIVNAGYLHIVIQEVKIQVNTKDVFIVTSIQRSWVTKSGKHSEIWVLSFNPPYFYGNPLEKNAPAFLIFLISLGYSKITLATPDFSILIQWFKLLYYKKAEPYHMYAQKILFRETQILLGELREIYFNYTPEFKTEHQHKYTIVFRFLQHLELYFREQHGVQFYADSLYLSPDYLSRVVREVTRKSAKQCIEEKIIHTAKALLFENKAITRISTFLGFKTTSHFCYFFKKHTSLTPSSFRKQYNAIKPAREIPANTSMYKSQEPL